MDKFLNNNIVLRVIAVVLACVLWFTINTPDTGGNNAQTAAATNFPYAIHVELAPNMMVSNLENATAVIEISSNTPNASSLPADMMNVQVVADARGLGPGTHTVQLQALNMPPVRYTIVPSSITVTLEQKVTESKPVQVMVTGTPASGYQAGDATTDVQTVEVSGAADAVGRVATVTAQVSVSGAKTTVSHTVPLGPVDKSGRPVPGVEVDPVNVTVTVPITPPQVSVQVTPALVGSPAAGYAVAGITVSPSTVAVAGHADALKGLSSVTVPVDVQGLKATQTQSITVPIRTGWTSVTPSQVQVTVRIEPMTTRTFANVPLQLENVPSGLQVSVAPNATVTVHVAGPQSIVGRLTTNDVRAYVDASGLQSGSTRGPVDVHIPEWVQVTQVSPATVPVTVASAGGGPAGNAAGGAGGANTTATGNTPGP